jgi:hypothetical protein
VNSRSLQGGDVRRIDDFIKLLVGLVIGQFLREAHQIGVGLGIEIGSQLWGEAFPFVFVAFVIRNIHASFRFDAWVAARNFAPRYETRVKGRAFSFFAGLSALFVSTFVVEHFLAHHLAVSLENSNACKPPAIPMERVPLLTSFLILPFVIYFVWDLVLWLQTDAPERKKDRVIQRFVWKWVITDVVGFVWLLACLVFRLLRSSTDGGLKVTIVAFTALAIGTVALDYIGNVSFYFGRIRQNKEDKIGPLVRENAR